MTESEKYQKLLEFVKEIGLYEEKDRFSILEGCWNSDAKELLKEIGEL